MPKAFQSVDGGPVTDAEVVRYQGNVVERDVLGPWDGPNVSIECGVIGHVENGLLGPAGTALVQLRQHFDHTRARHQKRGGERVRPLFHEIGRVVGA